jgi:molecular chaperone GrpE
MTKKTIHSLRRSSKAKNSLTEKKYDDLKKELAKHKSSADEYLNKLQYLQAEFENYQKRINKEIELAIKSEREKLILKMLIILDELEIVANAEKKTHGKEVMIEGLNMIIKKFKEMLENEGLSVIEAIGKPLDPNFHEVIAQVQTNEYPEGTIVEEFKKGYILHGKLLRPSVVSIAKT